MKVKNIFIAGVLSIFMVFLPGCSQKADISKVRKYSDTMAKQMLTAMDSSSYTDYIKDTDEQFKKKVSEKSFDSVSKMLKEKIGNYVPGSMKFESALKESQSGKKYIVAIYKAKYTIETSPVTITMFFDDKGKNHYVCGIYYNSPKIRGK